MLKIRPRNVSMELSSTPQNSNDASVPWVQTLSHWLSKTYPGSLPRTRTMISCDVRASKPALFLPPDMVELQPDGLEYLRAFAKQHKLSLIEDRRRTKIQPALERRIDSTPMIAKAISELLSKAGLPGEPPALSSPHRLNDDSPHICLTQLLRMAAFAADSSKTVTLPTNSKLINVLNNDDHPVSASACNMKTTESTTILSHFEAPQFRAVGYSAGSQYIVHVCLAGGPMHAPELWTGLHTLTRTDFQFQLIKSPDKATNLGLFYTTFYFSVGASSNPWWANASNDHRLPSAEPVLLSKEAKAG